MPNEHIITNTIILYQVDVFPLWHQHDLCDQACKCADHLIIDKASFVCVQFITGIGY